MTINLWDDAGKVSHKTHKSPNEHNKINPNFVPKQEKMNKPIWSLGVPFNGGIVDFPISYVIQHNNPFVYFEVLKTLSPPIMPAEFTPAQATTPTKETPDPIFFRFNAAVKAAVDQQLVPLNPDYANAKIILDNLAQQLYQRTHKDLPGHEKDPRSEVQSTLMEVVSKDHPDLMVKAPKGSEAWKAIEGLLLRDYNANNMIADDDGLVNAMQERNIKGRAGIIRSVILNTLRSLRLIRA